MKAVVMAGGFGTRLRPLTYSLPKPMVPMMNKPMMQHIIELLRAHGITDIVATLFYQPEIIANYFGDGSQHQVTMKFICAEEDYGTAGSVRNAAGYLNDRFIVISGDVLTDFNLSKAIQFHQENKSHVTLLLTRKSNPLQYGVVITDTNGNIVRFLEKPSWSEVFSDTINTGIYIIEPEVLQLIPYHEEFDFSNNLFPLMMEKKMRLMGYVAEGYWRDVGTLTEYQEAHYDCLSQRVNVELSGTKQQRHFIGKETQVKTSFDNFSGTVVLGNNCVIGEDVRLSNTVIGNNCTIEAGTVISNSVLWDNVTIGRKCELSSDVVASRTKIEMQSFIGDSVFIAEDCFLGKQTQLSSNIKLWPKKIVEDGAKLSHSLVWEEKWLRDLFTESRISGISNVEMNPEFGAKLGAAFGASLGIGSSVVTSYDADNVSRMMSRSLICGLLSAGCHVNDLRAMPIPLVRHELATGTQKAGFHVRKSPRDFRQTDIIFFEQGGKDLSTKKTKKIERNFFGEDFLRASADEVGTINFPERTTESYRAQFLSSIDEEFIQKEKMKIVIDYANGVASSIFPNILGALQCEVVALNAYLDSQKFTRSSKEFQDSVDNVANIVTSLHYDIGCIIDAGAEKISIIDELGNYISPERLLTLVTKLFLQVYPNTTYIAVPVASSAEIDLVALEYGTRVKKTRNTHLAMMESACEQNVAFVGGTRGGFIFTDYFFAVDGMFSFAKILELLAKTHQRLGEVDSNTVKLYQSYRSLDCSLDYKGKLLRYLMQETEHCQRELIDGVRILFSQNNTPGKNIVILPDKEESVFHLYSEAETQHEANQLVEEYQKKMLRWRTM
ncbi:MAG: nucleotidyltransferase [Ignavibacteria bacterium]|nr:nucleotidyltransferase [Ignavibacteria bacterium]